MLEAVSATKEKRTGEDREDWGWQGESRQYNIK